MSRRGAPIAAAVVAIVLLVGLGSAGAAGAAPGQEAADGEARLTLVDQPIAVAPDGDFPVVVAAHDAPNATDVFIDIYDRAGANEVIGIEPDRDPVTTFGPVSLTAPDADGRRVAGFSIELFTDGQPNPSPAWGHQIDEPGVYPLRIRLRDGGGDLAVMMTDLIRLPGPGQSVPQTKAAVVVGVHRPPPEEPAPRAATDAVDDELLDQLGPVLAALADRPALPATFSVTPDTAARLAGDPDAAAQLGLLRTELGRDGRTLIDAPYVDIDAASLVGADLADELTSQRDLGRKTLTALLEAPEPGVWQLHDRVDEATLEALRVRGIYRTVLPGDALTSVAGTLAPFDLPAGEGEVRAATANEAFSIGAPAPDDPILAGHLLLGRLAAAATTGEPRPSVIVTLDPAVATEGAMRVVLDGLSFGTPFFAATPLSSVLEGAAPERNDLATVRDRSLGGYPEALRNSRSALGSYASMVGGQTELIAPYEQTLAVSAAADLALDQRIDDAESVDAALAEPFSAISLPSRDKVTLGARDATFPLVITSDLDYPVQVVIELESNERLEFPKNRIEETLDGPREVVGIKVRTRATGDTPVRISVRTPDDGVVLADSQYTIRSTAVSGVGIVLTLGAALFLALWWGRHWRRTRRPPVAEAPEL